MEKVFVLLEIVESRTDVTTWVYKKLKNAQTQMTERFNHFLRAEDIDVVNLDLHRSVDKHGVEHVYGCDKHMEFCRSSYGSFIYSDNGDMHWRIKEVEVE